MSQAPTVLKARAQIWTGSGWADAPGDAANGLDVDVTRSALPTGAATETTLAGVKTGTDKIPALVSGRLPVDGSGVTQPVSAAALPLPSGAAQDSTLTGGSTKAIGRGGAKGATTAADITSTAQGADHQAQDVQIYHGGAAKDPTQVRALTTADVVTAAQGAPAAQANAWYHRPRQLSTFSALYRLAARPYPLSNVFAAAGRKQYATVFHAASAAKTLKIREVLILVRSISAAAIVSVELVRLTNATTPATGNPAITPQAHNPADTVEATCLALPTTAGTEAAGSAYRSWQVETAAVTPAVASTAPPVDIPWKTLYVDPFDPEESPPTARAGAAEGFAVVLDANAAATVTALVKIRFTEE